MAWYTPPKKRRPNRSQPANFELLRQAYAIFGGIPNKVINMDIIEQRSADGISCGTVACGMGWLPHHPDFKALGLTPQGTPLLSNSVHHVWSVYYKGKQMEFDDAARHVFNLTEVEAWRIFGSIPGTMEHAATIAGKQVIHKNVLLNRIKKFLIAKGQPVNSPILLPELEYKP